MPKDDEWEDTGEVEVPLAAPSRRLHPVAAPPKQSSSARAAFAAIRDLGNKFDEHAKADHHALASIDGKITLMQLEHTKSMAIMQVEVVKASTNVDRLIATVETNAAARLRVATEAESAALHEHADRRAKRREIAVKVLQWVGGPLAGVTIAWLLTKC